MNPHTKTILVMAGIGAWLTGVALWPMLVVLSFAMFIVVMVYCVLLDGFSEP